MQNHDMLTIGKLDVYQRFAGDIDGWARRAKDSDFSGMTDDDWHLIEELLLGLTLIASGRATQTFAVSLEQRLRAVTADDATRERLHAMV